MPFRDSDFDELEDNEYPDDWDAEPDDLPTSVCPNCGEEILEDIVGCPYCGAYISEETYGPPPQRLWIIIGVLITAFVILGWILSVG